MSHRSGGTDYHPANFRHHRTTARAGVTIFLVEQNANQALKLADRGTCWKTVMWCSPIPAMRCWQTSGEKCVFRRVNYRIPGSQLRRVLRPYTDLFRLTGRIKTRHLFATERFPPMHYAVVVMLDCFAVFTLIAPDKSDTGFLLFLFSGDWLRGVFRHGYAA